jgi:hypothetical protein
MFISFIVATQLTCSCYLLLQNISIAMGHIEVKNCLKTHNILYNSVVVINWDLNYYNILRCAILRSHTFRHALLRKTALEEGSAPRRDFYLTTHNSRKRQTFMPPAEFEAAIPASERLQTYALNGAATGICAIIILVFGILYASLW